MLPPPEGGASPAPTRLARVVLEMRAGNKKGRHPTGSAPTNRILWNTLYFPFFGPMRRSQSHISVMTGAVPPCHLAMYASAARDCQENSALQRKISCYWAIPP